MSHVFWLQTVRRSTKISGKSPHQEMILNSALPSSVAPLLSQAPRCVLFWRWKGVEGGRCASSGLTHKLYFIQHIYIYFTLVYMTWFQLKICQFGVQSATHAFNLFRCRVLQGTRSPRRRVLEVQAQPLPYPN